MSRPPQTLKNFFSTIVENDDQKRARIEREAQRAELQLEAARLEKKRRRDELQNEMDEALRDDLYGPIEENGGAGRPNAVKRGSYRKKLDSITSASSSRRLCSVCVSFLHSTFLMLMMFVTNVLSSLCPFFFIQSKN